MVASELPLDGMGRGPGVGSQFIHDSVLFDVGGNRVVGEGSGGPVSIPGVSLSTVGASEYVESR